MMPNNGFLGSIWRVILLVVGVRLLEYVVGLIAMLFGFLPVLVNENVTHWILLLVAVVVPTWGTLTYTNWKWGWKPENMGMARRPAAVGWVLLGLVLGAGAAGAAYALTAFLPGGAGTVAVPGLAAFRLYDVLQAMGLAVGLEVMYRGAVISRYQTDMDKRQVLWASLLTALAALIIETLFQGKPGPTTATMGTAAMSVALSLIFIWTDSVWFTIGLHVAMVTLPHILTLKATDNARMLVWGVVAAILFALEWNRLNRAPRRVQPGGRGGRGPQRGQTIRGPWGPH